MYTQCESFFSLTCLFLLHSDLILRDKKCPKGWDISQLSKHLINCSSTLGNEIFMIWRKKTFWKGWPNFRTYMQGWWQRHFAPLEGVLISDRGGLHHECVMADGQRTERGGSWNSYLDDLNLEIPCHYGRFWTILFRSCFYPRLGSVTNKGLI